MSTKLGEILTERRKLKGLTLRDVEKATKVSNGYLNLLEQGKIAQPSPNILYKLAEFYGVEYAEVLEAAGYASKGVSRTKRNADIAFSLRADEIDPEELKELKKFLGYLKSKKR
jgi:transcriptional regulator with XRE-family HTH domain